MNSLANHLVSKSIPAVSKVKTCLRVTNQYGVVFRTNDGKASTANVLSKLFGVSAYYVKKIYHDNDKNYKIANEAIDSKGKNKYPLVIA